MQNDCCAKEAKKDGGLPTGIIYGLIPHSLCIGFIIFSVIGALSATAIVARIMVFPYFFQILVIFSVVMATISAVLYLRKNKCLCKDGIKSKWKYLATIYSVTILTNLFMFYVVMPAITNADYNTGVGSEQLASLSLEVQIPCSGHAPLITDELKKDDGIKSIVFKTPDIFNIKYDPIQTSPQKIVSIEIFKTYKATIN